MRVGVAGASGYAGAELLRLCAGHPDLEVVVAGPTPRPASRWRRSIPSLAAAYRGAELLQGRAPTSSPGSTSSSWPCPTASRPALAPELVDRVGVLVDLSADFRLSDAAAYRAVVRHDPPAPRSCSAGSPTGCPSSSGPTLAGARLVAAPGCYPTAAALALAPLVRAGRGRADAASSSTPPAACRARGASWRRTTQFNTVDEDFMAYGLLHPPPHARDRAGDRGRRCCSRRTSRP